MGPGPGPQAPAAAAAYDRSVRALVLAAGGALAAIAAGFAAVSLYRADDLADLALPGIAALAAVAANVMFMVADRMRRGRVDAPPGGPQRVV